MARREARVPRPTAPAVVTRGREEILARLRTALVDRPAAPPAPRGYRGGSPGATGEVPARARLLDQLDERISDYRASVRRCAPADLAATLAELLADAATLLVPADLPDGWLAGYPGTVVADPADVAALDRADAVLTGCAVAIAETGTIVLDAGPGQGRRALTLVPDRHVCVVLAGQVEPGVPEGLARLSDPTRPLTFISGPSATSDIELDRVEGVHGPRRLDVVLVED
jgi:L-lactate dehydrogenase complex protein LldG